MKKSEIMALFEASQGITGPLCGYYEGDEFVSDEAAIAATHCALHGKYEEIKTGLKANPELLDDKDIVVSLVALAVHKPTYSISQGVENLLKESVRRKEDPEAKKVAATELLMSLMHMKNSDGSRMVDPGHLPQCPERLNHAQEKLVEFAMRFFLDTPTPRDSVGMLDDRWKKSHSVSFAEETDIPSRRLWNFGSWLQSVAVSAGRACGIGRTIGNYTDRINNLLKARKSDLRVNWKSDSANPPPAETLTLQGQNFTKDLGRAH